MSTPHATPLRWGIIGCGDVTEVKSGPAYQQTEGFVLRAVMRRDAEKVRDYAERHGVDHYYTDADQLINNPTIDAVYIATPPDAHLDYALRVAAAGKICCIEKPLAPTYAESLAISQAFAARGIPLFTAYYRRSLPRFQRVREWLATGSIGTVRHVSWHFGRPASDLDRSGKYNWRTDPVVAPGGYFDDLASHGLDLFAWLLGDFRTAHGVSLNQQGLYAAKDGISACWLHEAGTTGAGSWNFGTHRRTDRVELFGEKGTIEFSVFEDAPVVLDNREGRSEEYIAHPQHVQLPHVRNIARQLFGTDYRHPSTGHTAVHTAWVMQQVLGVA